MLARGRVRHVGQPVAFVVAETEADRRANPPEPSPDEATDAPADGGAPAGDGGDVVLVAPGTYRERIDFAHGRESLNVASDIGAIESG